MWRRKLGEQPPDLLGSVILDDYRVSLRSRMRPVQQSIFNPLECRGNCATLNNMKLLHWLLMSGLLHFVQRRADWGPQPAQALPRCAKCNSPPVNGSVPITVLLYNK